MDLMFLHKQGGFMKAWDGGDVHTKDGILSAADVKKGGLAKTTKGVEYLVVEPTIRDRIQNMKKGARPIYEYDAGLIAALLGIDGESVVLEAGTGSGCMTMVLANIAKKVETFEKEERFYTIAAGNFEKAGIKNIKNANKDLLEAKLGDYDAVFLDMRDPVKGIEKAAPHLKQGRFMAIFTPIIDDLKPIAQKLEEIGFIETRIIQLDLKELEVKKYARVKGLFGFPGFVIVARKFS
ncbi:rRNA adenine N-6-methyltransferase family protein [archaeon]